ncbi:class I SAM-dependent methyltransferase, partial [Leucobacter sp. M11]|uniref:class I SAM-dependent methyltransferase n=1 Tax=Leucobacter sp. M11 TaxID=2993565 RepID=UPI002D7EE907
MHRTSDQSPHAHDPRIDELRADLRAAGYGSAAVRARLGEDADEARGRGVLAPARRALGDAATAGEASPLDALIRLFLLREPLSPAAVAVALPALGLTGARELGLIEAAPAGGEAGLLAAVSLNCVTLPGSERDWWLLSDLDEHLVRGPLRADHVLGVGGATRSLLGIAFPVSSGERVLDLGTGCGVIALVAADSGARVVATDVSPRALRFAAWNAQLNGVSGVELRLGDRYEPVAGERFDRILSNPPFVITPRTEGVARYEYRDGGLAGDDLVASVLGGAAAHLRPGGSLQALANWEYRWGEDGLGRVLSWLDTGTGPQPGDDPSPALDAWVLERQRLSPIRYAETWARDGGATTGSAEFERRIADWVADFASRRVHGIGFGFVLLRAPAAGEHPTAPVRRTEIVSGPLPEHDPGAERLGAHLARALDAGLRTDNLDERGFAELRLARVGAVSEHREYVPGAEDPSAIRLVQGDGLGRQIALDTVLAAAVGASDGELTVGQIAEALAGL